MCGLCPTSPSLLGVCEYINSSATLIATSSFGVRVLLYVCVLSKNKKIKKDKEIKKNKGRLEQRGFIPKYYVHVWTVV